jgi:hypothetical protein
VKSTWFVVYMGGVGMEYPAVYDGDSPRTLTRSNVMRSSCCMHAYTVQCNRPLAKTGCKHADE